MSKNFKSGKFIHPKLLVEDHFGCAVSREGKDELYLQKTDWISHVSREGKYELCFYKTDWVDYVARSLIG